VVTSVVSMTKAGRESLLVDEPVGRRGRLVDLRVAGVVGLALEEVSGLVEPFLRLLRVLLAGVGRDEP